VSTIGDMLAAGGGYTLPNSVNTEGVWAGGPCDATGSLLWRQRETPGVAGLTLSGEAAKASKWTLRDETGKTIWSSDVPPEVEAREAVERQRKDEADRQERETAAKRAHELAVLKATLDHNAAVRGLGVFYPENVALLMGAAAVLSAVLTGLVALAIP
jgi:hypothetical protein